MGIYEFSSYKENLNMQKFHGGVHLLFSTGNTFFQQIWSKNQNCQFKLKFGT